MSPKEKGMAMGRTVDTRWYETYEQAKAMVAAQADGIPLSVPSLAEALGVKPKTLGRMLAAGRLLDSQPTPVPRECIRCGYVPLELLEKLSRLDPELAAQLLEGVLANQVKIPALEAALEQRKARGTKDGAQPFRTSQGSTQRSLYIKLDKFLRQSDLLPFDAYKGKVIKIKPPSGLGGYLIQTAASENTCLLLCRTTSQWRTLLEKARDLYEEAQARRTIAPTIWLVFKEENPILRYLAELSLRWGGSPFSAEHWLYLAHLTENGNLHVLFEDYFAKVICELEQGQQFVTEEDLCWSEARRNGNDSEVRVQLPLHPLQPLPTPARFRCYSDVVDERTIAIGKQPSATTEEKRKALSASFGL